MRRILSWKAYIKEKNEKKLISTEFFLAVSDYSKQYSNWEKYGVVSFWIITILNAEY